MTDTPKPIRRVVTGNDAQGRSGVLFDSAAPNVNPGAIVRGLPPNGTTETARDYVRPADRDLFR